VIGDLHAIRTDIVGSLMRPLAWLEARQRFDSQRLSSHALQEIELACVRQLVALQETVGLDVVTDGEIGRLNFQDSFGLAVSGLNAACTPTARGRRSAAETMGHSGSRPNRHRCFASAARHCATEPDQQRRPG
jgi:methionine synthase II (cobalamin-independent)